MEEKKSFKRKAILIVIALVGYYIVTNLSTVGKFFSGLFDIIFPFVLGGCLAFILNIPMSFFERKLLNLKKKDKKKSHEKSGKGLRVLAIIFAIVVIVLVLTLVIRLIVPELIQVVKLLIENIPYYIENLTNFMKNNLPEENKEQILTTIQGIDIDAMKNQIISMIPNVLTSSISIAGSILSGISTFFIAIVFAIYILMDKERLQEQSTKMLYAHLSNERAEKVINIGRVTKNIFKKFFTVQCLEATILGALCMIGMLILKIPYAVPIGVLVGVTALIPIVGAFIGLIIGAFLIVVVEPIKVIVFVIFVLILQQVEGNLIYPRVVGSSIGLPGMWVLFAVSVGGSLGGIVGMLIGVPVATIIYTLIKESTDKKLEKKAEISQ